jgi:hypothetical protein
MCQQGIPVPFKTFNILIDERSLCGPLPHWGFLPLGLTGYEFGTYFSQVISTYR